MLSQFSDLSNVSSTYLAYGSNEGDGFYLYKSNNMKVIQIHMTLGADKPDGTVFVTIPSEFRPSVSASYDMQIIDPTNHSVLGTLRIGSNGQITSLFTTFKAGRIRTFASYI